MRVLRTFVALSLISLLTACASGTLQYAPSSTLSASGSVAVGDFKYLPSINGRMDPDQIQNVALGAVHLNRNIDSYFRDAVFIELRFVGIKIEPGLKTLVGEINEFRIQDVGFSVDWSLNVHYILRNEAGAVLYDRTVVTKSDSESKFFDFSTGLNSQIKNNIEEVIKDPLFVRAIN